MYKLKRRRRWNYVRKDELRFEGFIGFRIEGSYF